MTATRKRFVAVLTAAGITLGAVGGLLGGGGGVPEPTPQAGNVGGLLGGGGGAAGA